MNKDEFAKAAKKAQGMNSQAFCQAILEERPDLKKLVEEGKIKPRFPWGGCSAHTVILGDEVFKTSQAYAWTGVDVKDLILGIERERNLLGYLKGKGMPLVPGLTYVGKGFSFFGMSLLPGEALTRWDVEGMKPDDKLKLAKELAGFCADLSNKVPVEDAKAMHLDASPAEWTFEPEKLYEEFSDPGVRKVFGDQYEFFKQAIEGYIGYHNQQYARGQKYLMHCDLKEGNILWDRESRKLTGVIDFGLSHLTGLESGFKKLYEKYPATFADMVMQEYSSLQSVQITRKEVQQWACVEYVAYVLGELNAKKSAAYLRDYKEFVRAPLQLASPGPLVKLQPTKSRPQKNYPVF